VFFWSRSVLANEPTTDAIGVLICAATTIETGASREWTEGPYDTKAPLSTIDRIHKTVRVIPDGRWSEPTSS